MPTGFLEKQGLWNLPGAKYKPMTEQEWDDLADWGTRRQQELANQRKQEKIDFYKPYLETIPGGVYAGWLSGYSQPSQNYYKNMFSDFWNEYQGQLASQAQQGIAPGSVGISGDFGAPTSATLDFGSFLKSIDLNKRYGQLTSRQKGFYNSSAAPRTRFLNW